MGGVPNLANIVVSGNEDPHVQSFETFCLGANTLKKRNLVVICDILGRGSAWSSRSLPGDVDSCASCELLKHLSKYQESAGHR